MVIFNLAQWVARQVTCVSCESCWNKCKNKGMPKNRDMKIFIVGPAGSGKSMSGLRFAEAVSRWISYYLHYNDGYSKAKEYFSFDKEHVAVISTTDLLYVMTKRLNKHSVKLIDDCGAAKGFTNRRSMSNENLDIASVYGTNRVQNGVTIYCVQDTTFTDIRMRKLANIVINLDDWYQEGRFRIARLRYIKKDNKSKAGIKECRFMTYERGEWVTQEAIACELPGPELKAQYDILRDQKEEENSRAINEKYNRVIEKETATNNRKMCPDCGSVQVKWVKKLNHYHCNGCGIDF